MKAEDVETWRWWQVVDRRSGEVAMCGRGAIGDDLHSGAVRHTLCCERWRWTKSRERDSRGQTRLTNP